MNSHIHSVTQSAPQIQQTQSELQNLKRNMAESTKKQLIDTNKSAALKLLINMKHIYCNTTVDLGDITLITSTQGHNYD